MSAVTQQLLDDSIVRLDAAIGESPGLRMSGTTSKARRIYSFGTKGFNDDKDLISILDGKADMTSGFGLSGLDNYSMLDPFDVTAPHLERNIILETTSAAILADHDPGLSAAQVLFSEFVNIMVAHPSELQVWDEVEAYQKVCSQQVEQLGTLIRKVPQHHANFQRTQQVYLQLVNERNTWRLLGSLYGERLSESSSVDDLMDNMKSDKTVIDQYYSSTQLIREAQIVIDWLERNASDDFERKLYDQMEYFGDAHIAWENTIKAIKNDRGGGLRGSRPLVASLDPDASLRQKRPLHDLDQEDEMRLVRLVFAHVRAGQIEAAQELCVRAGHHWRAATLEGWRLHHDPNPGDPTERNAVSGNPYRDVWKAVAWRAASDERLPAYERAIYGSLCGHLASMLGVVSRWSDVLWAYTHTLVDQWVEEQLRTNNTRPLHPLPKDYPEEKLSLEAVFESVKRQPEVQQHDLNNPYYQIQQFLILNDIESLLRTAHGWLAESPAPHLLRCLTHLTLFLKHTSQIPKEFEDMCTAILEACVKEAIERGDVEQVAWYTSVLPAPLQVEWYSRFLHNITDDQHRRHALRLATAVGLDVEPITLSVVNNIRLGSSGRDPEGELVSDTTNEDKIKLSAIDWLLYYPSQRIEALHQANAMLRSLLISRKITAARELFNKIPSDSIKVIAKEHKDETGSSEMSPRQENIVREYLCMKIFLDAQDSFTDWFDHFHQKKPALPRKPPLGTSFTQTVAFEQQEELSKYQLDRWKQTLSSLTKCACDRLYNVLLFPDGGWLLDSADDHELDTTPTDTDSPEPDRLHQMTVLRSIFIPQVTSLLQNILHSTDSYKECLQLADIISSEQYQLYKAFGSCELQRFLVKLQESSRELLDRNCDSLGYPLN